MTITAANAKAVAPASSSMSGTSTLRRTDGVSSPPRGAASKAVSVSRRPPPATIAATGDTETLAEGSRTVWGKASSLACARRSIYPISPSIR